MEAKYNEDSLVVRVGARIRALRTERGLSLRDLGKVAGVHSFHVMAVELGQLAATTKTLQAIAGALGVTPADLLNVDAETDDAGAVLEFMRRDPSRVAEVGAMAQELRRLSLH
jgi:transcriptional regulator with XRE-family HTH domain